MISAEERLTFVGEDDIEIEMRVPQEAVKLIIGRQGANIKQVSVRRPPAPPSLPPPHKSHPCYVYFKSKKWRNFFELVC